jgi:ribonuclease HI
MFSVRSAYQMLVSNREKRTDWIEHNACISNVKANQKDWTYLWEVKVPPKVRVFLWRLAKQSYPTGDVRHHRNMAQNSSFSICGNQDSWRHSLLECDMAKCVWALQQEELLEFISRAQHDDARGWLHEAIKILSKKDFVRLVVTMWSIWYARRKVIHEDIFQSPLSTHSFIERFVADLKLATPHEKKGGMEPWGGATLTPRWIPPPPGFMKVNVDVVLSKNSCTATMAAITRDEAGCFQGASVIVMHGISDPETAEVMACREGLALASDLMPTKVVIATDCENVVRNMRGLGMGCHGHIVREIKEVMAGFENSEIVHERRASNVDAHMLDKSSMYESLGRHVWLLSPPDGVCTNYLNI